VLEEKLGRLAWILTKKYEEIKKTKYLFLKCRVLEEKLGRLRGF
jgi:hypothetical protein